MDRVYSIFYAMRESTWMQNLYAYRGEDKCGDACLAMTEVYDHDRKHIPIILTELYESSWAYELELHKPDLMDELGYFLTVKEMRNIYITSLLQNVICYDMAEHISSFV